jgi:hypothetical protein
MLLFALMPVTWVKIVSVVDVSQRLNKQHNGARCTQTRPFGCTLHESFRPNAQLLRTANSIEEAK